MSNPIAIGTNEYDQVFDATVDVLRDKRYVVDRKDRRFGVVTTEPRIAASVFEPWYDDNSTGHQVAEASLNHERRTIRVEIQPVKAADDSGAITDRYQLFVQVDMDRRHNPPQTLNSAALGRMSIQQSRRINRPLLTERGIEKVEWSPIGRDELLEQRLVEEILHRAVGFVAKPVEPTPEPATPEPSPGSDTPADQPAAPAKS
ncbi:MAG: hypothetical protein GC159_08675 [Phycisphaera sp.]|nr:hypothetical protein [Phycisphaera sp.]